MTYRNRWIACALSKRWVILSLVTASLCIGGLRVNFPRWRWPLGLTFLATFAVVFVQFLNTAPYYLPTFRYPMGKVAAPLAAGSLVSTVLGSVWMGGYPDLIRVHGREVLCAVNHGKVTPLSSVQFHLLVASLPLALTAVLIHVLLENRWRCRELGVTNVAGGERNMQDVHGEENPKQP